MSELIWVTIARGTIAVAFLLLFMTGTSEAGQSIFSGAKAKEDNAKRQFDNFIFQYKILVNGPEDRRIDYMSVALFLDDYYIYAFNEPSATNYDKIPTDCEGKSCFCLFESGFDEDDPDDDLIKCSIIEMNKKVVFMPHYDKRDKYQIEIADGEIIQQAFFLIIVREPGSIQSGGATHNYDYLVGKYLGDPQDSTDPCIEPINPYCGSRGIRIEFDEPNYKFDIYDCLGTDCNDKGTCKKSNNEWSCVT